MLGMKQILFVLAVFLSLVGAPALADDAAPPEARALIEQQLDAFAHDDAEGAYALAAPGIKALFPDSAAFLAMVRESYAPVYRHRGVEFGAFADHGDKIQQAVTFIDNDNVVWTAIYILEKQPEGNWRIGGCVLTKSSDTSL
jgi:hypothetical protein